MLRWIDQPSGRTVLVRDGEALAMYGRVRRGWWRGWLGPFRHGERSGRVPVAGAPFYADNEKAMRRVLREELGIPDRRKARRRDRLEALFGERLQERRQGWARYESDAACKRRIDAKLRQDAKSGRS